jgi:hypothetical protein
MNSYPAVINMHSDIDSCDIDEYEERVDGVFHKPQE